MNARSVRRWLIQDLARDIPESSFHGADRCDGNAAPSPETGAIVHVLPQSLDLQGVLALIRSSSPPRAFMHASITRKGCLPGRLLFGGVRGQTLYDMIRSTGFSPGAELDSIYDALRSQAARWQRARNHTRVPPFSREARW
jgi:hypothetical protein